MSYDGIVVRVIDSLSELFNFTYDFWEKQIGTGTVYANGTVVGQLGTAIV